MLSIFKGKKKISKVFSEHTFWKYIHYIEVKDFVLQINTNNRHLNYFLKNTFGDFLNGHKPDYIFNFYSSIRKVEIDKEDDYFGIFGQIQFFNTFFNYRYHKNSSVIDVLLPRKYENWEIENFFKIFISSVSLNYNSLLIHASAIIIDGEAVLFSGQSGAGKSTIANLSGYELIHDDNILISHLGNGVFELESIPFKTPYIKKKFKGKIRGFYRLFQSNNSYVKKIDSNRQLTYLLFGLWAFDYFGNKDSKKYNSNVINYCIEILPYLKIRELYFSKNLEFLKFI